MAAGKGILSGRNREIKRFAREHSVTGV